MFLGEEAEDCGGPRRELWRLLELAVKERYFEGNESEVIPRHDTIALQVSITAQAKVIKVSACILSDRHVYKHICVL